MKPLMVLVITFIIALIVTKFLFGNVEAALSARIGMSAMLCFTAIGHFAFTRGMVMMMPAFMPFKKELVYFTGIIEIAAAVGLQIARVQVLTGWLLICFFVLVLPANIHAAAKGVDYQKASFDGPGRSYLWFRLPLQLLFITWTYISAVKY